ncbi:GEVED domain-containing protein, partial [Xanthomarina sp. F1114]|uniref:GEVED domain-containing protein n=1 Tax=Xanthomarina sp. F1114 TaxID=2996019 RepID=UPI00225DE12C
LDVGETYTVSVEGDTKGPFDNDIVAFIDWNQNGVLDDAGEVYEIGTLFDSVGDDGVSVTMDITVPVDVMEGETRIRLTKTYQDPDSPAGINPCAIEFYPFGYGPYAGYGQALDFTLEVAGVDNFPEPYCNITDSAEVIVEEITNVTFAGTSMVNADATTVLIDETATIVNLDVGETYTVSVEGDT